MLLDLCKPLLHGLMVNIGGITTWVTYKYERLPKFCFSCGLILHGSSGCIPAVPLDPNKSDSSKPYGVWLRAVQSTTMKSDPTVNIGLSKEDMNRRKRVGSGVSAKDGMTVMGSSQTVDGVVSTTDGKSVKGS